METNRRDFLRTAAVGAAGLMIGGAKLSASSYKRVIGANDRIRVAFVGLGRRFPGFVPTVLDKKNNIELAYLCDVMDKQITNAKAKFSSLDYKYKVEKDMRKIHEDKTVDAMVHATPDHWHTPGAIFSLKAGKHVYLEKPCSHNMFENEILVAAAKKYDRLVQMGNQQRSSKHTKQIITEIHNGVIGTPYKAVAFYSSGRGPVPVQKPVAVPNGLDWELFQGPAPRRDYTEETWNYNWHWYGWDYGTAELGNNGTHELDIARWALQVDFPDHVEVEATKSAFKNDGWEMYDEMDATYNFGEDKVIKWDGKSRNAYSTYGAGRGTVIYGSEGTVFVDRAKYRLYDRTGKLVRQGDSKSKESGMALGGGGATSSNHTLNFFNGIRGIEALQAPIEDASVSMAMVHYGNVAYRIGHGFDIDENSGKMLDRAAMKLWSREYEKGWEPTL